MAEETATPKKGSATDSFTPHGVQNGWLSKARGKPIQVRLTDGQLLSGRLAGHDLYCLALEEAGEAGSTLIYKHSISCLTIGKK